VTLLGSLWLQSGCATPKPPSPRPVVLVEGAHFQSVAPGAVVTVPALPEHAKAYWLVTDYALGTLWGLPMPTNGVTR
jgi:hypothetical protein